MSASKILFFLCISFVCGIFLQLVLKIPQGFVWGILVFGIVTIFGSLFIKQNFLSVTGFCLLFLALGVLRAQIGEFNIFNDKLSKLNDKQEKIVLEGVVAGAPAFSNNSQKIKVGSAGSVVLVTTNRYPEYNYLDKVKITGKLKTPEITDGFNYKNYLLKDGIYSVMDFPKIETTGKENPSFLQKIYSGILWVKERLRESIRKNYLPPQSLILEGTIVGDSGAMTSDLKNKLNVTGLRHIVAVSGTHIVILGAILMPFFLMLGLMRGQAFYLSITTIWFYVALTGLSASGIRAGIMGTIFLLAEKLGRQKSAGRVIVLAAAAMLFLNPLLLFYDAGFQLSFLAALGIICLDPILKQFFNRITKSKAQNAMSMISSTFSAQIFTLPILVYSFGNVSIVAPITNILILPIVTPLMVLGFLSSFFGIFSNILGWIFFVPTWVLLTYFVKIIDMFSAPWMALMIKDVPWPWLFISYFIIAASTSYLNKKYRQNFV